MTPTTTKTPHDWGRNTRTIDLPAAGAVDHGGLLERQRDRQVELADEEHLERGRDARDDEHLPRVEHAQVRDHDERREQDRERRDEQGHDAEHPPQPLAPEVEAREGVGGHRVHGDAEGREDDAHR